LSVHAVFVSYIFTMTVRLDENLLERLFVGATALGTMQPYSSLLDLERITLLPSQRVMHLCVLYVLFCGDSQTSA
jgi:hypothetical protein